MLESVHYRNFQPHERLDLNLHQVTTLRGDNRGGKSAAFRGLRWLMLNIAPKTKTGKVSFLTWGKKTGSVSVVFDGGRKLKRLRTKRGNSYILDGERLNAVGKGGIPEAVLKALNVTEDNFQPQFSSLYWFAESPSQISKRLNKIVDQSIIDDHHKILNGQLRESMQEVKICRNRIEEAREAVKNNAWTVEAAGRLATIEKLEGEIENDKQDYATLESLVQKAIDCRTFLRTSTGIVSRAIEICKEIEQYREFNDQYYKLWDSVSVLQSRFVGPICSTPDTSALEKQIKQLQKEEEKCLSIEKLVESAQKAKSESDRLAKSCIEHEKKFKSRYRSRCPACGTKLQTS